MMNERIGDGDGKVRTRSGPRSLGFLAFLVAALGAPALANASTAASTQITNTATVNFDDASGAAQTPVTATATVTVSLVPSAVTLTSPANQSIEQGTTATLTYTITSTANGPDTYNLSAADVTSNITGGGTALSAASLVLGGTTLAADATNGLTVITVPYDATPDTSVNGIAAGDTIVIGANAYVVSSVAENPGANTATITIPGPGIAGGTVATGQIIGERRTFTGTVTSGTVSAGSSGTHTVNSTAVSNTLGTATTTQTTPTVVTVTRPTLTVDKLVSSNGGTSFATTATAAPGTSLIYKIVITNTGVGVATAVDTTDVIPAYLTYVAGSAKRATAAITTYAGATALTDAVDVDGYTFSGGTVSYDPGSPGLGTVAGGGGVLVLFFRATVN
jgi:uncharacterized repeat protein (TIGR01451 family)